MMPAYAGQYLYKYERKRYTFRERFAWLFDLLDRRERIILPAEPEHFGDVSFYQAGMNWDTYALHARAAIIRIGQNTWPDTSFVTFYNQARERDIALGGYWFFDGRASPDQQLAVIKQQMSGRSFEMELFVDWEVSYGGAYEGLPRVVELMQKIEAAGIKCKSVGMYTGYYWFLEHSSATVNAAQYTYLKQKPLWLAWYSSASVVKVPPPWTDWIYWQYGTPPLKWGQPTVEIDANYFNGSKAKFEEKYLGGTVPPGGGGMQVVKGTVIVNAVKIRQSPGGAEYVPPRYVVKGDQIEASEVVDNRWLKLTKINGAAANGWSSAGSGQEYIVWSWQDVPSEPPPPPDPEPEPPAGGVADMPYTITFGGGTSPYVETIVSGMIKAK